MKFMQLIVAAAIALTALTSHAAFTSNPAMTEAQILAEIKAQMAATPPPANDLNAIAQRAADAGVNMVTFVKAAMDVPGVTPAQAVYAAVKAQGSLAGQSSQAALIAAAAATKAPNSSTSIAAAAARAAPQYADAIADAVAAVKPEWAWGIYAAVLNAVPGASLTWLNSQTFCLVASENCQTPTASPN